MNARTRVSSPFSALGRLLREWRRVRRMSQLDLALDAGVSARHLSFIETGRAQPSREMVLRLAHPLELPLREQNTLLTAAGYAPIRRPHHVPDPRMDPVVKALDFILWQLEPYPACVLDRFCNVLRTNAGAVRLLALFPRAGASEGTPLNLLRLALEPGQLRPYIVNWEEVARLILVRLRRGMGANPSDHASADFLEKVLAIPGLPAQSPAPELDEMALPVIPCEFQLGRRTLRVLTTLISCGTPQDATLQDLCIQICLPADAATDRFLRSLAPPPRANPLLRVGIAPPYRDMRMATSALLARLPQK